MINFNENDYNISKIKKESKLFNLNTKHDYRVYGLRKADENPLIFIELQSGSINTTTDKMGLLVGFMAKNKIEVEFDFNSENNIRIGMRKDLREHIVLSSCILQTIIYYIEGKLTLDMKNSLPGIPKFVKLTPESKIKEVPFLAG